MCSGGGGGGLDATTQDLQRYQLEQAKKEEQRLAEEKARQETAKNAIRVLYGYNPSEVDSMVSDAQKSAIYGAFDKANAKPVMTGSFDQGNLTDAQYQELLRQQNPNYAADLAAYNNQLNQWNQQRDAYYSSELKKLAGNSQDFNSLLTQAATNKQAREQGYSQIRSSNMAIMQDDIARNRADATRALTFGLARSGLTGGSVDIDENRNVTDANQRMLIQANQLADNQVAGVRAQDESKYANLIQSIDAGLDADTAITTATQAMQNNRTQAINDPTSSSLNNLFAGIGNAWSNYEYGKAYQSPYGSAGSSLSTASGSKGRVS